VGTVHQASATRQCYTADAADAAVDPVFLKPIGGRRAANLVGIFLFCSLARDHAAGPAESSTDCIPESPLDSQVWVSSITDLNCRGEAIPDLSVQHVQYLVCGLCSPGWAWRGLVRCRNGTPSAAPVRVTQGMMS
jgi:hypothetical protein